MWGYVAVLATEEDLKNGCWECPWDKEELMSRIPGCCWIHQEREKCFHYSIEEIRQFFYLGDVPIERIRVNGREIEAAFISTQNLISGLRHLKARRIKNIRRERSKMNPRKWFIISEIHQAQVYFVWPSKPAIDKDIACLKRLIKSTDSKLAITQTFMFDDS